MKGILAGLVMLIIGDSHIAGYGRFNNTLHEELVGQGASVHTFGICGSIPSDWLLPHSIVCGRGERHNGDPAQISMDTKLHGWALPALISHYHPNVVVVELGENMAGYGVASDLPRDLIGGEVMGLARLIQSSGLPCIWIGPTWARKTGPITKPSPGSGICRPICRRWSNPAGTSTRWLFPGPANGRRLTACI